MDKKMAAPCGTAKFREETSKKQRAEATLRCTMYGRVVVRASIILHCSIATLVCVSVRRASLKLLET
jgi:hypothetical protein